MTTLALSPPSRSLTPAVLVGLLALAATGCAAAVVALIAVAPGAALLTVGVLALGGWLVHVAVTVPPGWLLTGVVLAVLIAVWPWLLLPALAGAVLLRGDPQ